MLGALVMWVVGLGYWSFHIMDTKCFREVGPVAIEWLSLPVFIGFAGFIVAAAPCSLDGVLGHVGENAKAPFSQEQRVRQIILFDATLISVVWTVLCFVYANLGSLCPEASSGSRSPSFSPGKQISFVFSS